MSQPPGSAPSWSAREDIEPDIQTRKRRRRIPIVVAAFVAAIIVTAAVYFLLDRHSSGPGLPDVGLQYSGTVQSISDNSITIAFGKNNPPHLTASITSSTKYFGQHKGVKQIKIGDQVAMAVVGQGSNAVVFAIQDPGSMVPQG
jgi:hypothetical protein